MNFNNFLKCTIKQNHKACLNKNDLKIKNYSKDMSFLLHMNGYLN